MAEIPDKLYYVEGSYSHTLELVGIGIDSYSYQDADRPQYDYSLSFPQMEEIQKSGVIRFVLGFLYTSMEAAQLNLQATKF